MPTSFDTISPVDGRVYCTRPYATDADVVNALQAAVVAQRKFARAPLSERAALCRAFVDAVLRERDAAAEELTWMMGRPIRYSPSELRGFEDRARTMIELAGDTLAPLTLRAKAGFERFIERVPLGVVLTVAPWNYPYLTAVNSIIPALMAGNTVLLKHSTQTPLVAERFQRAFEKAGADPGIFQSLHCSHEQTAKLLDSEQLHYLAFTGSVEGGRAVQRAGASKFLGMGLELGGKDPAYVRADADLPYAVEQLVDGAYFNSGQSCCGIERIYVHASLYNAFVEQYAALTKEYRLGNPTDPATTLGPLVRPQAADFVREQIAEAVAQGAQALVEPKLFPQSQPGSAYLAPQVLINVDHRMRVMSEESFGPVVGIMSVANDDEAVALMNDSRFGLTASVWTRDVQAAVALGQRVETGTWFMNRCDYLDPELAWTGVKDSGRGCTLSRVGYEVLTRPKSFHLRTEH